MTKATETPPVPPARPTFLDFLLILAGSALSLYLMRLAPMRMEVTARSTVPGWAELFEFLPLLLRLGEGTILLWPLFLLPQRILGRTEGLTSGEWLWVLAWLGMALITGVSVWEVLGGMPEFLARHAAKPRLFWYLILVPALGALAAVSVVLNVFTRRPLPWTHSLGVALMLWTALPLAVIYAFGELKQG